ncbi:hypothetical protein A3J43_04435 [Candidatus Uhrbacteria bacterium RIFCSPHIGHO2_12_FULL_54_23]|uniref:Ribbon-helix-helix protein CopG domain-containing protein n=3 Tax=Candidatus Uhriibacteriota TaxID=1752732 RepID=A0A1F7UHD5_9BACT|nr:MAG: hypothetical protein A3J43_04435 [Candidatus Uhrbacteria bacterium RIFCSPHIGHO2_12_FULL_54_23]OGL83604.1 MAG: hypothetical protein A3B36_02930 [Candidatus Uhrbacteria bacterium RIFCSPLOWO2_01_FULL_55_36]OGL89965.1 MAG: hypothetical protein A3J36_03160 [Candidatus Uhrbacteria bacterium RIFCSPLOWO2_02_FULL_54_37]
MAKVLEKRTNILFDMKLWNKLTRLASERERSVGDLVRTAVTRTYFSDHINRERREAFERIMKLRTVSKEKIDYEELINYGRER